MATGDSNSRKDIAWKYAYLADPNKKNDLTCNFCAKVAKGGAYRLKQHLAGNSTAITSCPDCPQPVKEEVRRYMLKKKREGKKPKENDAYNKELREKSCVDIARWLYEAGIPLNAVNYDSFKVAIQFIGRYGIGMKPPSYDEVRVHSTEILGTSILDAGERSVKPDKLTEQPLSPKDARTVSANPSPDAVIEGPSRDVTKQQESTEAVTFHPLNANVSHEQNVSYGGNANNNGISDGHSQHAITEAIHVESQVICNGNPSAVFNSFNHFNPQMVYGQYSSVATPLPPLTNADNTGIWDGHSQHDEENDEGYKTCDDGPLLDDDGDYVY